MPSLRLLDRMVNQGTITGVIEPKEFIAPAQKGGGYWFATYGALFGMNGARIDKGGGLFDRSVPLPAGVVPVWTESFDFKAEKATFKGGTKIVGAKSVTIKDCIIDEIGVYGLLIENCTNVRIERTSINGNGNTDSGEQNYGIILKNCKNVTIVGGVAMDCHIGYHFTGDCSGIHIENVASYASHKSIGLHGGTFSKVLIYSSFGSLEIGSIQWPTICTGLQVEKHTGPVEVNGKISGTVKFGEQNSTVFTRGLKPPGSSEWLMPNVDIYGAKSVRAVELLG